MKKTFILVVSLLFLGTFAFCDGSSFTYDYKTGDRAYLFPLGIQPKQNYNNEYNSCYVAEISKAIGYPEGTYALKLTAEDWISANVCCAVTSTYIVKKGDILTLYENFGLSTGKCKFSIEKISDNEISLREIYDNKENP
jgi:hypothetical protein